MRLVSEKDYLEHHGIIGQKWGVRRYQNPDGTLTEAGKRRLLSSVQKHKDGKPKAWDTINKSIVDASTHSKELSGMLSEARALETEINEAFEEFYSNESLQRKALESYNKNHPDRRQWSLEDMNFGDGDDVIPIWDQYISITPELKAKQARINSIRSDYEGVAKQYYNELLGAYGDVPVPTSLGTEKVSDFLGKEARLKFDNLFLFGGIYLPHQKRFYRLGESK